MGLAEADLRAGGQSQSRRSASSQHAPKPNDLRLERTVSTFCPQQIYSLAAAMPSLLAGLALVLAYAHVVACAAAPAAAAATAAATAAGPLPVTGVTLNDVTKAFSPGELVSFLDANPTASPEGALQYAVFLELRNTGPRTLAVQGFKVNTFSGTWTTPVPIGAMPLLSIASKVGRPWRGIAAHWGQLPFASAAASAAAAPAAAA